MTGRDNVLWRALVDAEVGFIQARMRFLADPRHRIAVLREALRDPAQRGTALRILLGYIPLDERRQVFPALVSLASLGHSDIGLTRDVILSLGKEWVAGRIEEAVEPILGGGGEEEYRRYLELYEMLDHDLTIRLAARASASDDPAIREAGEDFSV